MELSATQRKFLVNEQGIGAGIFNAVIGAGLGWLLFHQHTPVPLKGDPSIAGDIIGTAFLLPFLSCLIVTPLVRKAVRAGKVEALTSTPSEVALLRWMPRSLFLRSLVIGLACLVPLAPLFIGVLGALGVESFPLALMIPFKALFAGLLAAVVTPLIALYALATAPSASPAPTAA